MQYHIEQNILLGHSIQVLKIMFIILFTILKSIRMSASSQDVETTQNVYTLHTVTVFKMLSISQQNDSTVISEI